MTCAGTLVDFQMLHGEPALGDIHLIFNTQLLRILAGDTDIGADIDYFEMIIMQLGLMPAAYTLYHLAGNDCFTEAYLIGKQHPALPSVKDFENSIVFLNHHFNYRNQELNNIILYTVT